MKKYKQKIYQDQGIKPCNNLETYPPNTLLVPPSSSLFLLVTSPGMLSPIVLHSFGGETFLWFQGILIISLPFPLDPVLDDAIPLVLLVFDYAFEGPLVTQRVRLYWSWLR